jgi:hypothetical protein
MDDKYSFKSTLHEYLDIKSYVPGFQANVMGNSYASPQVLDVAAAVAITQQKIRPDK